jgi:hypothetical protein
MDHKKLGYRVYRQVLNTQKLAEIKADAIYIFNKQIKHYNIKGGNFEQNLITLFKTYPQVVQNCGKIIQNLPALHKFQFDEMIMNLVERDFNIKFPVLNTKPVLFFHNKNLAKKDAVWKTPVHRDFGSTQGSLSSTVAWFPLVKTKPVGSLKVLPGSHCTETKTTSIVSNFAVEATQPGNDFTALDMEPGDLVLFSTNLVHKSGTNTTEDQIRWSVSYRYSDVECENWLGRDYYHPYTYSPNTSFNKYEPSPAEMEKIYGISN